MIVIGESSGRWRVLQIEAPLGKMWVDGGCTFRMVERMPASPTAASDALADAISRMKCGAEINPNEE